MKVEVDADELCELRMGSFGTAMAEKTLADIARKDRDIAYLERDFWKSKALGYWHVLEDTEARMCDVIDQNILPEYPEWIG